MIGKPFSPASERNRGPILAQLRGHFADRHHVLEIGSGTGQHAVHFAAAMPWLTWQCSDRAEYLPGIRRWLDEAALPNAPAAVELDVAVTPWAVPSHAEVRKPGEPRTKPTRFDAAFSANTLHIMSWREVEAFFAGLDGALAADAKLAVYGPFNYGGRFTSDSNAAFDASLKSRDAAMGIREFEAVDAQARAIGLRLVADEALPANNRLLVWHRHNAGTRGSRAGHDDELTGIPR